MNGVGHTSAIARTHLTGTYIPYGRTRRGGPPCLGSCKQWRGWARSQSSLALRQGFKTCRSATISWSPVLSAERAVCRERPATVLALDGSLGNGFFGALRAAALQHAVADGGKRLLLEVGQGVGIHPQNQQLGIPAVAASTRTSWGWIPRFSEGLFLGRIGHKLSVSKVQIPLLGHRLAPVPALLTPLDWWNRWWPPFRRPATACVCLF